MALAKIALKTVVVLAIYMILTDVAAVILTTLFDIMPTRGNSSALPYAVWFVFGIFCGLFVYMTAGAWASPKGFAGGDNFDWGAAPGGQRLGLQVLAVGAVVLIGLTIWSWRTGLWDTDPYVPDSAPHSITFFLSILVAMIGARQVMMPQKR